MLNWIWAIGNNVWIGLLALIPYAGIVMQIALGIKGNEWAWRNRKWDSVEHFKRTQNSWLKWGVGLNIVGAVVAVIVGFIWVTRMLPVWTS